MAPRIEYDVLMNDGEFGYEICVECPSAACVVCVKLCDR